MTTSCLEGKENLGLGTLSDRVFHDIRVVLWSDEATKTLNAIYERLAYGEGEVIIGRYRHACSGIVARMRQGLDIWGILQLTIDVMEAM